MEGKPPTKSQRRRANQRRRKQYAKEFDGVMGPMPAYPEGLGSNLDGPITPPEQREAWEKAPAHMVDHDEYPSVKDDEIARMSKLASESRSQERDTDISQLKVQYGRYWGKPGGAEFIASNEELSVKTVQGYFKAKP